MATARTSQNGWPVHPTSAGCVSLSWITGRVDPKVHDLFDRFCKRFNAEVEPIIRAHSWGYANRPIRGSSTVSNHASGTAIDLNAPAHPMGKRGTFTAKQERAIRAILRDFPQLTWGEDWKRPDGMHFEINVKPEALMAVPRMASPAEGRFTSGYGPRNLAIAPWHAGVDIANSVGTPIYAAFAGKVEDAGWGIVKHRSGNGILIRNPDGERQYYGHLSRIRVKVGQSIARGERIGDMGATGNVTGPHLHFETWANSSERSHFDPAKLFRKYGISIGSPLSNPDKTPPGSGGSPAPGGSNMATPEETWKYRGFDYGNPKAKTPTTKDHQTSRTHQYTLNIWGRIRSAAWRKWLAFGVWDHRGTDYVSPKSPSSRAHQLSRAHEYSLKQPSRVWGKRTKPLAALRNSFPSIRSDGYTMKAWVQFDYLWSRRNSDKLDRLTEAVAALASAQSDAIGQAVRDALVEHDKRVVQVDVSILDAAEDDADDPDALVAADADDQPEATDDTDPTDSTPEGEK